jgi:hypothetical protein
MKYFSGQRFFWIRGAMALAWLFTAAGATAQTAAADVGLVTKVSGQATYWNQDECQQPSSVQAFMKVRRGDRLELAPAASLTLLYFGSGRQETWKGPATLVAGDTESTALGDRQPLPQPEVRILPVKASKRIAAVPLSPSSPGKSGAIQTMSARSVPTPTIKAPAAPVSGDVQMKIKEARQVYQDLKKSASTDDITPELYFVSVLAEYKQFGDMDIVVDAMLRKRPGDPALKELKAWGRAQAVAGN